MRDAGGRRHFPQNWHVVSGELGGWRRYSLCGVLTGRGAGRRGRGLLGGGA